MRCPLRLRNASTPTVGQNPQNRKRGFRGQKTPISQCTRQGALNQKKPHFPGGALYRNGDFLTQSALFWCTGKWEFFFFVPKPSFPDFGDFDPCRGSTRSQLYVQRHEDQRSGSFEQGHCRRGRSQLLMFSGKRCCCQKQRKATRSKEKQRNTKKSKEYTIIL